MKRFLVGIGFSIVLISTGCAMSVFELKDYRVVDAYTQMHEEIETLKTTVDEKNELRINLDTYADIIYEVDDDLGDKVEIDIQEYLDYRFSKNKLTVDGHRWYDIPFGEYLDVFLDGLKDEKLYIYDSYNDHNDNTEIIIRCSEKTKEFIRVTQD